MPAQDLMTTATSDEMMELAEGQELFSSNLFRLQLAELLSEVRIHYRKAKRTNKLLHELKDTLEALPSHEMSSEDVEESLGKRRLYRGDASQAFTFAAPSSIHVAGSFLLHSQLRGAGVGKSVDLLVQMPSACFHRSDASSFKYHDKRNAYMLHLARCLKRVPDITNHVSVSVSSVRGDPTRCYLRLSRHKIVKLPAMDDFDIHIYPVIAEDLFKSSRLAVDKNNVRLDGEDSDMSNGLPATPHYNNSVLEDASMVAHLQVLHEQLNGCPAMLDALLLLKVWMRQRELDESEDGLNGFLLAVIMTHLAQPWVRKISKSMSSYQVFKVTLDFLAKGCLLKKGIALANGNGVEKQLAAFAEHFEVVILDQSGCVNVGARLSRAALVEVASVATTSMHLLESTEAGSFESLFLQKVPFHLRYDAMISLSPPFPLGVLSQLDEDVQELLRDRCWSQVFLQRLRDVLAKGLGKRVHAIAVRVESQLPWNPDKDCREEVLYPRVSLGLTFDDEYVYAANTVGPSADAADAEEFRQFWGDKSELVRFADGQILEAVDWASKEGTRHLIVEQIVQYVLHRHLGVTARDVTVQLGQLDHMLVGNSAGDQRDEAFTWNLQLCEKFEKLAAIVRKLGGLPLAVNSVLPAHSVLSYTHATPVLRHALLTKRKHSKPSKRAVSRFASAIEVVVQFEGSGQWPDDIVATRKLLSAFLARISNSLESEHSIKTTATETYVDVFYGGYTWRVSIYLEKYLALLEQQVSIDVARPLRMALQRRPAFVTAMRGLQHSTRVFGETARLAKRWAAAHLFMGLQPVIGGGAQPSGVLSEQAVELVVARLFLDPAPFASAPRSRVCGFARFLHVLATHPWATAPYVVDLNEQLTTEQRTLIDNEFQMSRSQGSKGRAMFIASPLDVKGEHWSGARPTTVELARVVAAAERSLVAVERRLKSPSKKAQQQQWKAIFRPELEDFDALIVLEAPLLPGSEADCNRKNVEKRLRRMKELQDYAGSSGKEEQRSQERLDAISAVQVPLYKNMQRRGPRELLVGFNPLANFISSLEAHLGEVGLFFHGSCGESVVGIVWRPAAFLPQLPKPRALQQGHGVDRTGAAPLVVRSVFDIVHDIRSIGAGLVKDIVLVTSDTELK